MGEVREGKRGSGEGGRTRPDARRRAHAAGRSTRRPYLRHLASRTSRSPCSVTRAHLAELASLHRRPAREALGVFLVEGVRSVEAAVDAGAPLADVLVTEDAARDPRVAALLARVRADIHTVGARDIARVSDVETAQGVVAVARIPPAADLARSRRVLALDGVQDPGNVGTLVRTAAWFGVDAVVAGPGTADFFAPKVVRSAMGGLWDLGLARVPDLAATLADLRAAGFAVYGATLGGTDAARWAPRAPSALVLGSEAHGLAPATLAALDEAITLAGSARRRGAESLNVAVAGGVLMQMWGEE